MIKHDSDAGKIVVVSGAASESGREAAIELARRGAWLALADRSEWDLHVVARLCRDAGGQVIIVPTDVRDPGAMTKLTKTVLSHFGRIDDWIEERP